MSEETSPCRHEYVIIFQRKLKGLERRLVGTRAYLPVGFKMGDFKHLSAGSFCFCSKCRTRLFPKRSPKEKEEARLERKRAKEAALEQVKQEAKEQLEAELAAFENAKSELPFDLKLKPLPDDDDDDDDDDLDDERESSDNDNEDANINVDELEVESVDVEDIMAEGVKLNSDDDDLSCEDGDDD